MFRKFHYTTEEDHIVTRHTGYSWEVVANNIANWVKAKGSAKASTLIKAINLSTDSFQDQDLILLSLASFETTTHPKVNAFFQDHTLLSIPFIHWLISRPWLYFNIPDFFQNHWVLSRPFISWVISRPQHPPQMTAFFHDHTLLPRPWPHFSTIGFLQDHNTLPKWMHSFKTTPLFPDHNLILTPLGSFNTINFFQDHTVLSRSSIDWLLWRPLPCIY